MGIKTTPRVEVYFGGPPTDRTENRFLARLEADLYRLGQDAVIFANFLVGPKSQQIDALVATETGALLVEIKGYGSPVRGALNGAWSQRMPDGTRRSLGSRNPYHQASDGRFAVADLIKTQLKRDGLPALDGLVCLYPSPPSGTDLPTGDFKAWIGGYDRALELLEKRRIHPLALDDWRTLARSLNLEPREQTYASAERVVIDDYCRRYGELAGVLTGPYAPVELRLDDCLLNLSTVGDLLRDGSHLQIVGPSGCGKSALLSRLGQDANTGRFAPIPVSARMFTGDLGSLMKRGLASATGKHLSEFLRAADVTGVVIVLLIDGFNECPTNFQNDLLKALLAARLRYGVQIVLTSQHPVDTPVDLDEVVLELPQPSPDHTRAIVEARLDRPLSLDELPALEIVRTANDAAVLAEVIRTPHAADGRHALYSAFARRRIGDAGESHGVGRGLRNLATHMRQEFISILPRAAALRRIAQISPSLKDPDETLRLTLASGLLEEEGEVIRFRHDLFADFFAADQLLADHPDSSGLRKALARPIHAELAEFVVGGSATAEVLDAVLDGASTGLLEACLRGVCGTRARRAVLDRYQALFDRLDAKYAALRFELPAQFHETGVLANLEWVVDEKHLLSDQDVVLLKTLPVATRHGLLPDILTMIRRVSVSLNIEAERLRQANPSLRLRWETAVQSEVYGLSFTAAGQDFQDLFQATKLSLFRRQDSDGVYPLFVAAAEAPRILDYGEMFFLFEGMSGFDDFESPPPSNLIELVQRAWDSRIYHLQLLATDIVVRLGSRLTDERRLALGEVVETWFSNSNAWLNGSVFDALRAIDCLEETFDVDTVAERFEAAVALPDTPEARQEALTLYGHTIDHPYDHIFSEAFSEKLTAEQRRVIHERAFGAADVFSMFKAFLASELFTDPAPSAIEVLRTAVGPPMVETHSIQDSVSIFVHAIGALARLEAGLPTRADLPSSPAQAWNVAGDLVYEMNRSSPSEPAMRAAWERLEALGATLAVDVIIKISEDRGYFCKADVAIHDRFADGVLRLSRTVLDEDYEPQLLFDRFDRIREGSLRHRRFALEMIALGGRSSDLRLVRGWLDDPRLGPIALETARQLEARPSGLDPSPEALR